MFSKGAGSDVKENNGGIGLYAQFIMLRKDLSASAQSAILTFVD